MIAMMMALAAISPAMGLQLDQRHVAINRDAADGPPDAPLLDDIYSITGQHLCDRETAARWKRVFDARYGARLIALRAGLMKKFGEDAMNRDIIRISSCKAMIEDSDDARDAQEENFRRRLRAFDNELVIWEQFAASRPGN